MRRIGSRLGWRRRTLATLPGAEQAGRLTREPEPAGFSMFAGVTPRAAKIPSVQLPERNQKQQNDAKETQRNEAKERLDAQRAAGSALDDGPPSLVEKAGQLGV